MTENQDVDAILREIAAGLTGDAEKDVHYLVDQVVQYRRHEKSHEIVEGCRKMLRSLIPDEFRAVFEKIGGPQTKSEREQLAEIRSYVEKKDFKKALELAKELVEFVEEFQLDRDDDAVEYRHFNETFEHTLYCFKTQTTKNVLQASRPYADIYGTYAAILVEMKRFDEARAALQKGLRWSPCHFGLTAQYAETFKLEGRLDEFFEKTIEAFDITFRPKDLARLYRNLAYYFVEKEMYNEAAALYFMCQKFDKDAPPPQQELLLVFSKTGGQLSPPGGKDFEALAEKYKFPLGAKKEVMQIAYHLGMRYLNEGNYEVGRYFFQLLDDMYDLDDVKEFLAKIDKKIEESARRNS